MNKEKYISTTDLARIFGVTRQAIQKQLAKNSAIKIKKIGSSFLYEINSLPLEMREKIKKIQKETAEEVIEASKKGKEIDIKKELWKAANKLRGSIDPSEYKYVVLGLIFLKYVSDAFYQRREELTKSLSEVSFIRDKDTKNYYLNQKDPYKAEGIFYIPEKARWEFLQSKASQPDIGKYIDEAMEEIEKENPELKGILPKIYSTIHLDSYVLNELINIFSKIKFDHNLQRERDILGEVYEYFIGQFASAEGKRGGQFFTPRSIVKLLVEILEPYEGARIFDPACGSGGMFVQSGRFLRNRREDPNKMVFYGQELNIDTWKLCKMNLAIRGMEGYIEGGSNSYYDDKFPDLRADFVLSNPPFNDEKWNPDRLSDNDPRIKYGIPPASHGNFMWIQHFIYHLAPNGMAGFVMANGALATGGKEGEIRKKIIEDDLIDVIIACPPKLFANVTLPVSLWFITKNKKNGRFRNRVGETLFIDAREIYEPISRKQYTFTPDQIIHISSIVKLYRGEDIFEDSLTQMQTNVQKYKKEINNLELLISKKKMARKDKAFYENRIEKLKRLIEINNQLQKEFINNFSKGYKDVPGLCRRETINKIKDNGYVLTPGRYVGIKPPPDDGIPFEVKMKKLTTELKKCFEKNKELEEKVKENLKEINS